MVKPISISVLTLLLTACGAGNGDGLNSQGLPTNQNPGGESPNPNGVTLASLQENIFGAICNRCHTGSTAPHGLRLDSEDNSYAFLVNHAADEIPELMRVNPGHPDDSYIIRKLEGAAGIVGGRMPLGGPYLSQDQINRVRDWITNGAPRSGTGTAPTAISKVSIASSPREKANNEEIPSNNSTQDFSASLHFSRAIQPGSVDNNSLAIYYTTTNSNQPVAVENIGVLVMDQSIEINTQAIPVDAQHISLELHTANESPIIDIQQRAVESAVEISVNKNKEDSYEYQIQ